ncbi:MAG: Ig-like domain-containing protein [Geobacteraceae bacterium]
MSKKFLTSILAFILAATASSALAAVKAETFTFSPFIGGYTFDGEQHLKTRPVYGIRGGYNFTDNIGLEAVLDFVVTKPTRGGNSDAHVFNYRLEGLYHFMPWNKLVPFLAIGGGGISVTNKNDVRNIHKGVIDYGAGVEYALTEDIAIRGDIRHLIIATSSPISNFEYTVGITFAFGGEAKPAPTPVAKYEPIPEPVPEPEPTPSPAADTTAPTVTFTSPVDGATAAPVKQKVNVAFSEEMDPATITAATFTVKQGTTPVAGKVTSGASTAMFTPAKKFESGKAYTATITTGAKDRAGNAMASNYAWNFTAFAPPKGVACVLATLEDTHFLFDSSEIAENGKTILDLNATTMQGTPEMKIRIAGYTSASGSEEYNQKLSERRATAVKEYLVKVGGIDRNRITTIGYGEKRPAKHEAVPSDIRSDAAHANMRVLIEIIEE